MKKYITKLVSSIGVCALLFSSVAVFAQQNTAVDATTQAASTQEETGVAAPTATVQITDIEQLTPYFPDANFRTVVFETLKDGNMGAEGTTVEAAIGNFSGTLDASGKSIADARGLELLRKARSVNISNNLIEDWSFLGRDVSTIEGKKYYGEGNPTDPYNTFWDIKKNPFRLLPENFGGRLVIIQPATDAYTYQEDRTTDQYYVRQGTVVPAGTLDIGRTTLNGAYVEVKAVTTPSVGGAAAQEVILETDLTQVSNDNCKLQYKVLKSGVQRIGIGIDQVLRYMSTDEYDSPTPGSQSYKYYLMPGFWVYDSVKLTVPAFTGKIELTKTDKVTTATLSGAVYSLYKNDGTVVQAGLTTDASGTLSQDALIPGDYYLKETTAPAGYQLDSTEIPFAIEAPTLSLGGGKTQVTTETGTVTAGANEVLIAGPDGADTLANTSPDITLTATGADKIQAVVVTYSKMNDESGAVQDNVTHSFATAELAQNHINTQKNANRILGEIQVNVTLKTAAETKAVVSHTNVKTATPTPTPVPPVVTPTPTPVPPVVTPTPTPTAPTQTPTPTPVVTPSVTPSTPPTTTPNPGPATGDTSNVVVWFFLLAASVCGVVALIIIKRKKN